MTFWGWKTLEFPGTKDIYFLLDDPKVRNPKGWECNEESHDWTSRWKRIWKSGLIIRDKTFLWKTIRAGHSNLNHLAKFREISKDCGRYRTTIEDYKHIFWDCYYSGIFWDGLVGFVVFPTGKDSEGQAPS